MISGILRIFFQVVGEHCAYRLVDSTHYFVVPEFGFGLAFELRFLNLYRNNGSKSFAEIVTVDIKFKL